MKRSERNLEKETRKLSEKLKDENVRCCGMPFESEHDVCESWNVAMNTTFHVLGRFGPMLFLRDVKGFWSTNEEDLIFRFMATDETELYSIIEGRQECRPKYVNDPFNTARLYPDGEAMLKSLL